MKDYWFIKRTLQWKKEFGKAGYIASDAISCDRLNGERFFPTKVSPHERNFGIKKGLLKKTDLVNQMHALRMYLLLAKISQELSAGKYFRRESTK